MLTDYHWPVQACTVPTPIRGHSKSGGRVRKISGALRRTCAPHLQIRSGTTGLLHQLKNDSSFAQSVAEQTPDHDGAQYVNFWWLGVVIKTLHLRISVSGSILSHDTISSYFRSTWPYFADKLSWDITTTRVNSVLPPYGVAKSSTRFGWGKGGKVTVAGLQVTLCDPIWHVISRSSVMISITKYPIYFTFTLRRRSHGKHHAIDAATFLECHGCALRRSEKHIANCCMTPVRWTGARLLLAQLVVYDNTEDP